MPRYTCTVLVGLIFFVVVFVAFIRDPTLNTCAESARGYERRTEAELGKIQSNLGGIVTALGDQNQYFPVLARLTPAELGILHSMDRQCKLLASCMRLSLFVSANTTCQVEYKDYNRRVDEGLSMLISLSRLSDQSSVGTGIAASIAKTEKSLAALADGRTSGATGNRIRILNVRIEKEKNALRKIVSELSGRATTFVEHYAKEN